MKVLYHANCLDGAGAAFAAWYCLADETDTGEKIQYIPVQYGSPPPKVRGEDVYILDFSYKRDVLLEMAKEATWLTIIDHHKTAQEDLKDIEKEASNICAVFDMTKSGAVLAWEFFNPETHVPAMLLHIQDRDLWKFDLKNTKAVCSGLKLIKDFRDFEMYILPSNLATLAKSGAAINQFLQQESEKVVKTTIEFRRLAEGMDLIPIYNLQGFMISDTLHLALERYTESPYAVAYFDLPNKRVYSLRSRQSEDVDVSEIAKQFGGGGHKTAAGFSTPLIHNPHGAFNGRR